MDITDHANAIHRQADQMRSVLWSFVFAAIAAYVVWKFASAPWWVYPMLFTRSVFGFAQLLSDEPHARKAPDDRFDEVPTSASSFHS